MQFLSSQRKKYMSRVELLTKIKKHFSELVTEIDLGKKNNLLAANVYAETTILRILNELHDLELGNANQESQNYPAIDLIDRESRIAIQVTSTSTSTKIKNTLRTLMKNELYNEFDILYICILGDKPKIEGVGFDSILEGKFAFDVSKDIIGIDTLLSQVLNLDSVKKIKKISSILEEEVSEEKQKERKRRIEHSLNAQNSFDDFVYPNLLELILPDELYSASLNYKVKEVIEEAKDKGWRFSYKQIRNVNYIGKVALKLNSEKRCKDWFIWNDRLYSFRDLHEDDILSNIIDKGTVEKESCEDFYESGSSYLKILKHLIICTLGEELPSVGIEQYGFVFRFMTNKLVPKEEKRRWEGVKKKSTRTVVKEMKNSETNIITSFRHLAMELNIHLFDNKFYLSVNPTYNYSSAKNIYKESPFANKFLTAQKRLEKNKSVFYSFQFISYVLCKEGDFNFVSLKEMPSLKIELPVIIND